ncbi:MAG: DUF86 domain-containing protein [Acidobacteria bacterium]|nr:DUF86 domain-containing protein [Acidobacteriota bacterium]MBV9476700.1 DUF86 domain-containing protein [Acidobacteriota bacterium]
MSNRTDDSVFLGHIRDLSHVVMTLVAGATRERLDDDVKLQFALTHAIQSIGEAARRISRAFIDAHPEIPWADIIGMRHRLVHDYFAINLDIVWKAATVSVPQLLEQLESLTPPEPPSA